MADKSVDRQASDLFNLGSNFKAQSSSSNHREEIVSRTNIYGDTNDQVERNTRYDYRAEYEYVGTDLASDLTAKVGQFVQVGILDEVVIAFAEKQPVKVTMNGHNHAENAHAAAGAGEFNGFSLDLSTIIGSNVAGYDVPAAKPFANSDSDSDQIALNLTFRAEHQDVAGHDGNHFVGKSFNGMVTAACTHLGATASLTTTGWVVDQDEDADGNQDFDKVSTNAQKTLSRTYA